MNKPVTETTDKAAAEEAAAAVSVPASTSPPYSVKDGVVEVVDVTGQTPAIAGEDQPHNPAAWMHERIVRQILEFEKGLDPDQEVGGRFVQGPSNEAMHIESVANWGPDMIVFLGQFPDGRKFQLMQHYSQANVLLVSVPKMREKSRRIGFELLKNVNPHAHPWGDPIS